VTTNSGFAPLIAPETAAPSGFAGSVREDRAQEAVVQARRPANRGRARARVQPAAGTREFSRPAHAAWHDNFLHPHDFAQTVHREVRRTERSGAPLSIVQYQLKRGAIDDPQNFEQLLAMLLGCKRETDMLGVVGVDTFALLCPDTDDEGARGVVNKIAPLVADLPVVSMSATYPDHLFDSMSRESSTGPTFHSFIVPNAQAKHVGTYRLKNALDIALALAALTILAPFMLFVALMVKLTSRGPVIFKQQRLGKGGVPFTFYKFRSMVVNGDDRIHREYTEKLIRAAEGAPPSAAPDESFKMRADPRITRFGRFIRTTSIDELPQLFNVLKGDMSMVGPRPCIPYEAAHYEPWHLRRILAAKPGITGVWQVEGRSRVSFSEMVRMDLRYIRDCSLALDLRILVKTVAVVIRCDGAS